MSSVQIPNKIVDSCFLPLVLSDMSNDGSICPNTTEGVTVDNNSESDGDKELNDDKHATKAALALKKISNMSRKNGR